MVSPFEEPQIFRYVPVNVNLLIYVFSRNTHELDSLAPMWMPWTKRAFVFNMEHPSKVCCLNPQRFHSFYTMCYGHFTFSYMLRFAKALYIGVIDYDR